MRMCATSVRISGPLNANFLRESIECVVRRHESLRTRISLTDGAPGQQIDEFRSDYLELQDLSSISAIQVEKEAKRLAQEFVDRKSDLFAGPLFDAKLLKLSESEHALILTIDHFISDAISYAILNRDIWASYNQVSQGLSPALPTLPLQFADYAVWQQKTYDVWINQHGEYWRKRLASVPSTRLPLTDDLTESEQPVGAMLHFPFGKVLTEKLRIVAERERTRLSMVILTIYSAVVSSWCGQRDLLVGLVSHGRHMRPELKETIGLLINTLPLRIEIVENDNFIDLLKRVGAEVDSARGHQDFDRMRGSIKYSTELSFNWLTTNGLDPSIHGQRQAESALRLRPIPLRPAWPAKFLPFFFDSQAGINVTVAYRPDVFTIHTVERFGRNLRLFAAQLADHPLARVTSVVPAS